MTVTNCISYWLSSWVREYGVDGFRCDTAKFVELSSWRTLHDMCTDALKEWKSKNPDKKLDDLDFWMTGECWNHKLSYDGYYTEAKFDSMINFDTTGGGVLSLGTVAGKYEDYAGALNSKDDYNVLSYMSSHDSTLASGDRKYLGSALMLLPGGIQVYYGDESGRGLVPGVPFDGNGGAGHVLRSDMNWDKIDKDVLDHWKKVGTFRNNHIAVGAGNHTTVSATSGVGFTRTYAKNGISDRIAACIGATPYADVTLDVNGVWKDGSEVINYYDNSVAIVSNGSVTFNSGENGTILVGDNDGKPSVIITGDERFTGTQQVTVSIKEADSAIISVDGAKKFIVHDGDKFTIGETAYDGDKVTVSYEVMNEKGKVSGKKTFIKEYAGEEDKVRKIRVNVKLFDGAKVYIYAFDSSSDKKLTGNWPGTLLTQKDEKGYYYCDLDMEDGDINTYTVIFNSGPNGSQTGDYAGLKGDTFFEQKGSMDFLLTEKDETKLKALKEVAREVKNMTASDYTEESWNVLYSYIDDADALIALGEDNADEEAISELYDEIVLAKSSLILAKPVVTEATEGTDIVMGTAAYGANVTVEINGQTYDAIADEITGEWKIVASELIQLTDVIYVSAYRGQIQSEQLVYDMSHNDNQQLMATLKVGGSTSDVNLNVGDSVQLEVEATGGIGSYTYKYVMKNMTTGAEIILKNYSSAASYTGPLTSVGTKKFTVYVKDSEENEVQTNTVTVVVSKAVSTLSGNLEVNGSTSDVNLTVGANVTLVPTATGGSGSYTYKYVMENVTAGKTMTLKDYSSAASYVGRITSVGTKKFTVYVKDSTGKVVETNTVMVVVTKAVDTALSATLKVNGSTSDVNLTVGANVTLVPTATGGSGSYTYKYVMENVTAGKTMTLKDYSGAASYVGRITSVGTKKFTVYVKDSTGKVVETNTTTVVVK